MSQDFTTRQQSDREDWMQYLDALEGLRSQGFPDEPVTTKRYECLQRFIEAVRDPILRRELSIIYASKTTVTEPPTVESLRFTTRQLQPTRSKSAPYDPKYALRPRPHPFAPLPPNKMVLPQGVFPPPPVNKLQRIRQQHHLPRAFLWVLASTVARPDTLLGTVLTATKLANLQPHQNPRE